jgi:hypothetical protein
VTSIRRTQGLAGVGRPAIFEGVENREDEIFPDPMSEAMAENWRSAAAKALERQFAALVQGAPAAP